jgi:hypothetical protein
MTARSAPPLGAMQTQAVQHGSPQPPPTLTLDDLNVIYSERAADRTGRERVLNREEPAGPAAGYIEVYLRTDVNQWFVYREGDGGTSRSRGYPTREAAEAEALQVASLALRFWDELVAYREAGDVYPGPRRDLSGRPIVRAGGVHYVIGPEPPRDRNGHLIRDGGLGFGGSEFRFRMLADGQEIVSHNVWYQGRIPSDYRDRLPDNAEVIPPAAGPL